MKTKFAVILIILGIAVSFGSTKIKQQSKSEVAAQNLTPSKPVGGFLSEEH